MALMADCKLPLILSTWLALCGLVQSRAAADVIVVSNRTSSAIPFSATSDGKSENFSLAAGDLAPIRVRDAAVIAYRSRGGVQRFRLAPNSVCFFAQDQSGGAVQLHEIGFGGRNEVTETPRPETFPAPETFSTDGATITVKILVDDDQPLVQRVWEPELRKRIAACSDILRRHCFVRLKVVAAGSWDSDDATTDFSKALREFEREVDAGPAQLAIGFTSQFHVTRGRTNLGGIREPFSRHILIREWRHRASESGRLELLVHELGHYLGAAHSPEQISAMRPVLADKQANAVGFRVGYDPVNTLIANLVAEELRNRDLVKYHQLTPWTKAQLTPIYAEIARTLPKDPAAPQFVALMNAGGSRRGAVSASGVVGGARHVLAAVLAAAEANRAATGGLAEPLDGDPLAELYFRQAASAALELEDKLAAPAYLLGLAVALGQPDTLARSPVVAKLLGAIENPQQRKRRAAVLGNPTMHGRADLLAHFVVSAALAATGGSKLAESAGFLKEYADAGGDSGFSFADLAADYAGIQFAVKLGRSPDLLNEIAGSFVAADYVLSDQGLPEGLSSAQFVLQYGTSTDERFLEMRENILLQVAGLPGYAGAR